MLGHIACSDSNANECKSEANTHTYKDDYKKTKTNTKYTSSGQCIHIDSDANECKSGEPLNPSWKCAWFGLCQVTIKKTNKDYWRCASSCPSNFFPVLLKCINKFLICRALVQIMQTYTKHVEKKIEKYTIHCIVYSSYNRYHAMVIARAKRYITLYLLLYVYLKTWIIFVVLVLYCACSDMHCWYCSANCVGSVKQAVRAACEVTTETIFCAISWSDPWCWWWWGSPWRWL